MKIERILHAALFTISPEMAWGQPMLIWGRAGSGKTAMVKAAARKTGLHTERLSPAERGEGQFGVIAVPSQDRQYLDYPAPRFVEKFQNGGLLFLDEINTAPPALQPPLLGAVQLRTIGASYLGDRTRVIGAANETRDGTGTWNLGPSLRNRFGHLSFEGLDLADWLPMFLNDFEASESGQVDALAEEARVEAAWSGAMAGARGLVAGFLGAAGPSALDNPPPQGSPVKSWPTRRTVQYATHALAASQIHGLTEDETNEYVGSFVGNAWVNQFVAWRLNADLPDAVDVLEGRVAWQHSQARVDRTVAVLSACAALVIPTDAPNRIPRATVLWRVIGDVLSQAPDCVMSSARALARAGLDQQTVPSAAAVMGRLEPIMRQAGVI